MDLGIQEYKLAYHDKCKLFVGVDNMTADYRKAAWQKKPVPGYRMVTYEESKTLPVNQSYKEREPSNGNNYSVPSR